MSAEDAARERRRAAAAKYKPDKVDLLLVAEAPPKALDRYFYFEEVRKGDSLFRYVCKGVLGRVPTRTQKVAALAGLCRRGVFLIDLSDEPMNGIDLAEHVEGLVERCRAIDPRCIILIKMSVYEAAFRLLREASLPVVDERIPFPGSGQQPRFETAFARALEACA